MEHASDGDDSGNFIPNEVNRVRERNSDGDCPCLRVVDSGGLAEVAQPSQTGVPVLLEVEPTTHGDDSGNFIPNEVDRVRDGS